MAGRERKRREGGAKGKISPCNDHGGDPQKPQSVANKKSTQPNRIKQKKPITPKTQEAQNAAAVIPVHSKHTNHHGSYTFIYWRWHRVRVKKNKTKHTEHNGNGAADDLERRQVRTRLVREFWCENGRSPDTSGNELPLSD